MSANFGPSEFPISPVPMTATDSRSREFETVGIAANAMHKRIAANLIMSCPLLWSMEYSWAFFSDVRFGSLADTQRCEYCWIAGIGTEDASVSVRFRPIADIKKNPATMTKLTRIALSTFQQAKTWLTKAMEILIEG